MQNSSNDEISKIIDMESRRLDQKRQSVDFIRSGQKRMMLLNDSYRKRYLQYMKIILIIVTILALFGLLQYVSSIFTFIPSALFDILSIIVISFGIIYIYLVYVDIGTHNRINYDELDLVSPNIPKNIGAATSTAKVTPSVNPDLFNLKNVGCLNSNCCSYGTTWNENTSVCVPDSKPNSTTPSSLGQVTTPSSLGQVTTPFSFRPVTTPASGFSQATTPARI